jgi:hypothetical protein
MPPSAYSRDTVALLRPVWEMQDVMRLDALIFHLDSPCCSADEQWLSFLTGQGLIPALPQGCMTLFSGPQFP